MKRVGLISLSLVLLDQLVKNVIMRFIAVNNHITVFRSLFYIAHVHNKGAAWSILDGNRWLLISIAFIALLIIYFSFLHKKKLNWFDVICYSLLIGGIVGNLIDRVFLGYVIDYLEFIIIKYHFPIFNFADICIVISICLIIIKSIQEEVCKNKVLK